MIMASGIPETMKLMVNRPARGASPSIKVYKAGAFLEVYINDILAGKVMKLSEILCPEEAINHCSQSCIRLKHHTILLTDEEEIDIEFEFTLDRERREERKL